MAGMSRQWQVALREPGGNVLYAQQLDGDGYDSACPFDVYIATAGGAYVLQETIDGEGHVGDDASIDWAGLLAYACEYADPPASSPVHAFCDDFGACEELDADDISEFMMDHGLM